MDNNKIRDQLNQSSVPENLQASIRANWRAQIENEPIYESRSLPASMISAFGVLIVFLTMFVVAGQMYTPTVVELALKDIELDAKHNAKAGVPLEPLLQNYRIKAPFVNMPVKLAKKCNLNDIRATHLRVAGTEQGEVHIFIHEGGFDVAYWQARQGQKGDFSWELVFPRDNLTVMVIRSHDMNKDRVKKLIKHMFYV